MKKSNFLVFTLLSLLMLSTCSALVAGQPQYENEVTIPITIDSNGRFTGSAEGIGVAYEIQGVAGATGSVTATIYPGNPQPDAPIPEGISLTRFVVIEFSMSSGDFSQATIYITYTDEDVANLQAPYSVYKYVRGAGVADSYVEIPSTVDTASKMITVTVTSIDDPLFAIGGATVSNDDGGISGTAWVLLAASVVVIVLLAVVGVWYFKKK